MAYVPKEIWTVFVAPEIGKQDIHVVRNFYTLARAEKCVEFILQPAEWAKYYYVDPNPDWVYIRKGKL